MRKLWLALLMGVCATGAFGVATAEAQLDPTFASGGVLDVQPPLPATAKFQYIRDLDAAPDGSGYALFERARCVSESSCASAYFLYRYGPTGLLDPAFGGPEGSKVSDAQDGAPVLGVDARGRPLVAQSSNTDVTIRRFTATGALDSSFGAGGVLTLPCSCGYAGVELVPGPEETLTVVISGSGPASTLIRLLEDGALDRRFGKGGSLTIARGDSFGFPAAVFSPGGALYLLGRRCCDRYPTFLIRISARGRVDKRFARTTRHSLASLEPPPSYASSVTAVLVRPKGKIDLLGYTRRYRRGFELRLNPNGRLHRRFGKRGRRLLPQPVAAAALGSGGTTLTVSRVGGTFDRTVGRILADGRVDRSFPQESLPGVWTRKGLSIVPQAEGGALLVDLGLRFCRSYCAPEPRLIRILEKPPR
jgi:uncharacterized delta-60 repeat protein